MNDGTDAVDHCPTAERDTTMGVHLALFVRGDRGALLEH